jgi:ABC-type branched-subunit amino acid transport system substrate-binding protein
MANGLRLWAQRYRGSLLLEDDGSRSRRAAEISGRLHDADCDIVLGPYGSDSTRAVATSAPNRIVWNHGAAADDVQRLPNVISIPTPASGYLVALADAVSKLHPGARVAVITASGPFTDFAWQGLRAAVNRLDLVVVPSRSVSGGAGPSQLVAEGQGGGLQNLDAVLMVGPLDKELPVLRELRNKHPGFLLGGVSPGLIDFPRLLGTDPEGFLAPVQWHPSLGNSPKIGPPSGELIAEARSSPVPSIDYVAAQAYAAALIASHCIQLSSDDPGKAARQLKTSTFFGDFELDPSGVQRGHQLAVIQWRGGRQVLQSSAREGA